MTTNGGAQRPRPSPRPSVQLVDRHGVPRCGDDARASVSPKTNYIIEFNQAHCVKHWQPDRELAYLRRGGRHRTPADGITVRKVANVINQLGPLDGAARFF